MIISRKYQFFVACPTKTGTTTLQNMVGKFQRDGGDPEALDLVRGLGGTKHRMEPDGPLARDRCERYMLVRDPYARLVSMYEWLRRKTLDEPIGAQIMNWEEVHGRADGWRFMLHEFTSIRDRTDYFQPGARKWGGKRPWMWTDRLSELEDVVTGIDTDGSRLPWYTTDTVGPIRIEHIQKDWAELLSRQEVRDNWLWAYKFPQLNSTKPSARLYPTVDEYFQDAAVVSLAANLVGPDRKWYRYV